jgi:hypothetical protein
MTATSTAASTDTTADDAAPLAPGAVVRYHGRRPERHGLYVVIGPCLCRPNRLEDCAGRYRLRRYLGADVPPAARGITHIDRADITPTATG